MLCLVPMVPYKGLSDKRRMDDNFQYYHSCFFFLTSDFSFLFLNLSKKININLFDSKGSIRDQKLALSYKIVPFFTQIGAPNKFNHPNQGGQTENKSETIRKQSSQQLAEARKQGLIQPVTPESKKQGIVNPVFTTRGLLPDIKESEKGNFNL